MSVSNDFLDYYRPFSSLPQFVLPSRGPMQPTRRMHCRFTGLVPTTPLKRMYDISPSRLIDCVDEVNSP